MLVKVWSNRNSHSLLMGMPNGTATQEDNMGCYIYLFWWCWVFVAVHRLSLDPATIGYSLIAVHRLPIVLASLTEGHRLCGAGASTVVTHRFSYPMSHGIFPDQGLNPCPLHWQVDSLPLAYHGSPGSFFKKLNILLHILSMVPLGIYPKN